MTPEQEIEFEAMRKEFEEDGLIYAPNSMYHGMKLHDPQRPPFHPETILKIEKERLIDFISYLFDESEHCDHIAQKEAYDEFIKWEYKKYHLQ